MKITQESLLAFIEQSGENGTTIAAIKKQCGISHMTAHRHLNTLVAQGHVYKKGVVPKVSYYATVKSTGESSNIVTVFPADLQRNLNIQRYQIEKDGTELVGSEGFIQWCNRRKVEPLAAAYRWYKQTLFVDSITTRYGIDATKKADSYGEKMLDHLWYASIYALPEFGKTKIGQYMEMAKVQPSTRIFDEIIKNAQLYFYAIIQDFGIDALCFVQPTAKRSLQIMAYAEKILGGKLPIVPLEKKPGFFPMQKTIKETKDRIANARASFEIVRNDTMINHIAKRGHQPIDNTAEYIPIYNHVLIIDDAVGSGSTFIEIARKIKNGGYANHVSALSFTGTANGVFDDMKTFEVISSV